VLAQRRERRGHLRESQDVLGGAPELVDDVVWGGRGVMSWQSTRARWKRSAATA